MNLERALKIMDKRGLDAIIASSAPNLKYLCNYHSFIHQNIPGVQVYAILPNQEDAKPVLIFPVSDMELAPDLEPHVDEFVPYGMFIYYVRPGVELGPRDRWIKRYAIDSKPIETATGAVSFALNKLGLKGKKIGLDESNFTPKLHQQFVSEVPAGEIVDAYEVFREIRMVKTPEEIEILEKAVRITESAFQSSLAKAEEGVSEKEFQEVFEETVRKNGAFPLFTCIYFGPESYYGQVEPSFDKRLTPNSLIRYDVGCVYKGFCSDIARTAFWGQPMEIHKHRYQTVREAQDAALEIIKPGTEVSELFEVALRAAQKRIPEYKRTHIGHGIGLELYEPPLIAPTSDIILEGGMVLNVEPPYYELGLGGFQVEDTIVVTDSGYRFLTTLNRDLIRVSQGALLA